MSWAQTAGQQEPALKSSSGSRMLVAQSICPWLCQLVLVPALLRPRLTLSKLVQTLDSDPWLGQMTSDSDSELLPPAPATRHDCPHPGP